MELLFQFLAAIRNSIDVDAPVLFEVCGLGNRGVRDLATEFGGVDAFEVTVRDSPRYQLVGYIPPRVISPFAA